MTACGRVGFDPAGGAGDSGSTSVPDAAVDAPAGAVTVAFGDVGVTFDTTIDGQMAQQGNNFGGASNLIVNGNAGGRRLLLRFDTSSIPTSATVFSATIELTTLGDATGDQVACYSIQEVWDEGNSNGGPGAASWTERQPGVAWFAIGVNVPSVGGSIVASLYPAMASTRYASALSLGITQIWIGDPFENLGLMCQGFGNDGVQFASSEATDPGTHPALTIVYLP